MRISTSLIVGAAAVLATSVSLQAEPQKHSSSVRNVTITGCDERASDVLRDKGESGFVLAHSRGGSGGEQVSAHSGRVYQLEGGSDNAELSKQLGYRVIVKGHRDQGERASATSGVAGTSGTAGTSGASAARATDRDSTINLNAIRVDSVERTTGACPAGW